MKPQYVPNSFIVMTKEGKAQEVADGILALAKQQGRKDIEIKGVLDMIDTITLGCPEDFALDVRKNFGADVIDIEKEAFRTIVKPASKKSPRP